MELMERATGKRTDIALDSDRRHAQWRMAHRVAFHLVACCSHVAQRCPALVHVHRRKATEEQDYQCGVRGPTTREQHLLQLLVRSTGSFSHIPDGRGSCFDSRVTRNREMCRFQIIKERDEPPGYCTTAVRQTENSTVRMDRRQLKVGFGDKRQHPWHQGWHLPKTFQTANYYTCFYHTGVRLSPKVPLETQPGEESSMFHLLLAKLELMLLQTNTNVHQASGVIKMCTCHRS